MQREADLDSASSLYDFKKIFIKTNEHLVDKVLVILFCSLMVIIW